MKLGPIFRRAKKNAGVTLIELMVTAAILAIGVLAAIASFRYITVSIQNSKTRTLANNLAQEQIEKLKNLSYYMLLVTTNTQTSYAGLAGVDYDSGNYPPATIMEGGIKFTRLTRVDFVYQTSTGTLAAAPSTTNDTGLKQITTYVVWQNGTTYLYQEMRNLMANPAANPLNATFSGSVKDTSANNIAGAYISVVDNPNWYGFSNSAGTYQFTVSEGSYTLQCSSQGYFSKTTNGYLSIDSGQTYPVPQFTLTKMSSGTAYGYAFLDTHLVISQVVASTGPSLTVEYIELYNPTTSAIFIGSSAGGTVYDGEPGNSLPSIIPVIWGNDDSVVRPIHLHYVNTTIPANGFYLISNTGNAAPAASCSNVNVASVSRSPDACWNHAYATSGGNNHMINCGGSLPCAGNAHDAGGVGIMTSAGVTGAAFPYVLSASWQSYLIDKLGWNQKPGGLGNAAPSDAVEGTAITCGNGGGTNGLDDGEQLTRWTIPLVISNTLGRAYDSNTNSKDFSDTAVISYAPYNSAFIYSPFAGTPATGALVSLNDPLSNTTSCNSTTIAGGYSACLFSITNIATGTWTMEMSSGNYYVQIATVVIPNSGSFVAVPNLNTTPVWNPFFGYNNALLNDTTNVAFVSGVVTDGNGVALSNTPVYVGGQIRNTSSTGRYFTSTSTGDTQIIANYNNGNHAYTSQSSSITTSAGLLYDVPSGTGKTWFTLSLGGILRGYFQTGSNTPLPGRVAVALSGGNQVGQTTSGSDGHFYLANMTTGTYTVEPALDPAEASFPSSSTVVLASTGTSTAVSTFTITSGLSEITGQVLLSSQPITTGVLVVASTVSLSGGVTNNPPPSQSGGSGILCNPCYYAGSSDSTGNYTLNVRASATPYKVYGWYTSFNGTTPTSTRSAAYTVSVSTTGQIISQNLSW